MNSAEEKAKSKSVSLLPGLWDQVENKAKAEFGGNRSDYIRTLVSNDLKGVTPVPDAAAPDILLSLCQRLRPDIAPLLAQHIDRHVEETGGEVISRLNGFYQPAILARLLEALLVYLSDGSKHGWERPMKITDRELFAEVEKALLLGEPEIAVGIFLKLSSLEGADMAELAATNERLVEPKSRAAFIRRWRAELDLPFTPALSAAEDPIPYPRCSTKLPHRPPKPPATGTTP